MLRLLAAILITCCLTAQLNAQASKEQASKEPSSKEQESAGQTAAASSATTQFPLDAFQEFSAIMVGSMMPGDERESYIYRSGKLMRNPTPEGYSFEITNLSTSESFGVTANACIHDRNPYFRTAPFSSMKPGYTAERTAAGEETVDGHSCKIEDVTISAPKRPELIKLRLWEAEDLQGFPIKVEFRRVHMVIHYKNVVLGPQDPTLFIYPKDCEESPKGPGTITTKPGKGAKKPAAAPAATPQQ
jgi:hypothetical protein